MAAPSPASPPTAAPTPRTHQGPVASVAVMPAQTPARASAAPSTSRPVSPRSLCALAISCLPSEGRHSLVSPQCGVCQGGWPLSNPTEPPVRPASQRKRCGGRPGSGLVAGSPRRGRTRRSTEAAARLARSARSRHKRPADHSMQAYAERPYLYGQPRPASDCRFRSYRRIYCAKLTGSVTERDIRRNAGFTGTA